VTTIARVAVSAVGALALMTGIGAAGLAPAAGPGQRAPASPAPAPAPSQLAAPLELSVRPAAGSATSLNSAGYAVSRPHVRFRFVRATFFVPYLNCALSKGAASAHWVGLDGFVGRPDSVEQDGIEADCSKKGKSSYRAWYAMYPRRRYLRKIAIKGGDSVTASVYYDAADHTFSLALKDNTTGGHFRVHRKCPHGITCPRNSAEMVSSAPATGSGASLTIEPLADYGALSFGAIAITNQAGQRGKLRSARWGVTRIVQTQRASPFRLVARPTPIQGDTFDNYWSRTR
jgi:hypothetical protein